MKIYLASSWRNARQPEVLKALRDAGHEVYDFRNPVPGNAGFSWRQVSDIPPAEWTPQHYREEVLTHPTARRGFAYDMGALSSADATVLVLPCGRSAHLELGYAVGNDQRTYVLFPDGKLDEPELMYLMCDRLVLSIGELLAALAEAEGHR